MITQALEIELLNDCAGFTLCDKTTYSQPSDKRAVVSRNLAILNECGDVLVANGKKQRVCIDLANLVAGSRVLLTIGPVSVAYTVLATDVVVSGGDVSVEEASIETAARVARAIVALFGSRLSDQFVTLVSGDCGDCRFYAEATVAGIGFTYSGAVTNGGSIAFTLLQANVPNFNFKVLYRYSFTGQPLPIILSGLQAFGQQLLLAPLSGAGATLNDQLLSLATQLNDLGLGLGDWYVSSGALCVITQSRLSSMTGTANGSAISITPTEIWQDSPSCLSFAIKRDGIFQAVLTHELEARTSYLATLQIDQAVPMTPGTSIVRIAATPMLPLSIDVPYSTTFSALLDLIVSYYNAAVAVMAPQFVNDLFARRNANRVEFVLTNRYLQETGLPISTPLMTFTIVGPGAVLPIGTQPAYNVLPPTSGQPTTVTSIKAFPVLCRANACYAALLAKETSSCRPEDQCVPKSTELMLLMQAVGIKACRSPQDLCASQDLFTRIAQLCSTEMPGVCTNC